MSEISNHISGNALSLAGLIEGLGKGGHGKELYDQNVELFPSIGPREIILAVDALVRRNVPMDALKSGISKALNLLGKQLKEADRPSPHQDGFLDLLTRNNTSLKESLSNLRPLIKSINQDPSRVDEAVSLREGLQQAGRYEMTYVLKENVLFPVLEKAWEHFRCIQVMWSIHDDVRRGFKDADRLLDKGIEDASLTMVIRELNQVLGDLYFDLHAIAFREEYILIPFILGTMGESAIDAEFAKVVDLSFPYINAEKVILAGNQLPLQDAGWIDLGTGRVKAAELAILFHHLPVDITYVDENDTVRFYTNPPHRIFPRTPAVIGRRVQDCHPRESIDIVNRIVDSFRRGERDKATFWINIKQRKISISYYALRGNDGEYRGVLEVSQDVTDVLEMQGEKRLLDW